MVSESFGVAYNFLRTYGQENEQLIKETEILDFIANYCCCNDGSWQPLSFESAASGPMYYSSARSYLHKERE